MASITGTDIVRGAYRLMGRPSQADLPYQDVIDNAHDVVNGFLLELKLSNRNHTAVIGSWVNPAAQTESIVRYTGDTDFIIPVKCEWRVLNGGDTQIPQKVEFCAVESIDELQQVPQEYVALYNNNTSIRFSAPLTILLTRQYRLIYEPFAPTVIDGLSDEITSLPDFFKTLCQYETAAISINQVQNITEDWTKRKEALLMTIMPMLVQWRERFERWKSSRYGNRKVRKNGFAVPRPLRRF